MLVTSVTNLKYSKQKLVQYFKDYYDCIGDNYVVLDKKENKNSFKLNLRPGINLSALSIGNSNPHGFKLNYGGKITFIFGVVAEFIMSFNKNKWAFIIEPTYRYYKSETENIYRYRIYNTTLANYKSIELPMGVRHYFFISENSKLFLNASFVLDFVLESEINNFDVNTGPNFAFGAGYKLKDKYSMEFRYLNNRDFFDNLYFTYTNKFRTFSVVFGYTLF